MRELTRLKWLCACLYFVQGGVICYFQIFQKPYLNSLGIERTQIGLLNSLLLVPFILKVGFGWISDRYPWGRWGRRKPYMAIGLAFACSAFFLAAFFPAHQYFLFYAGIMLLASFAVALFDASTDGMAVDRVPDDQQGSIQSYMVTGKALGVILLSTSIGHIVEAAGYRVLFFGLGAIFILPLLLTLRIRTDNEQELEELADQHGTPFWKRRDFLFLSFLAIAYSFSSFGTDGLVSLYLSDFFKISESQIGIYGSLRGVGAILGAVVSGHFMNQGRERATSLMGLCLVAFGAFLMGSLLNADNFKIVGTAWGFMWGFQEVCFLTIAMRIVSGANAAFAFALVMALGNVGTAIGEALATGWTATYGFSPVFYLLSAAVILPIVLLIALYRHEGPQVEAVLQDL